MPEYNWDEAKLLDESRWSSNDYTEIGKRVKLATLGREPSRENTARAFMLACGFTFEDTFDKGKKEFGNWFDALLGRVIGHAPKDLDKETERFSKMANVFLKNNPESAKIVGGEPAAPQWDQITYEYADKYLGLKTKDMTKLYTEGTDWKLMLEKNKEFRDWFFKEQDWSKKVLEEMCYVAVKKATQLDYPDIDYSDLEQVRAHADKYGAFAHMGLDIVQVITKDMENSIAEKHPDISGLMDNLLVNNHVRLAMQDACIDPGNTLDKTKLQNAMRGRMILDLYGKDLAGMSAEKITEKHSFREVNEVSFFAMDVAEDCTPDQYQKFKDYLDGKPNAIVPGYIKNGRWVRNAAYDLKTPKFDFSKLPDQLEKTDMFDKVFADFTDNPAVRGEEPIVKRIFIDGKNAYDMFKEKYQDTKGSYEDHVKREIVQAVMSGEQRVELARLDRTKDGTPKATVVPVKADLSGFDKGKKWYERSVAKKAEDLWKNDKGRESRIESIKNAVEEKQRAKLISDAYHSTFYNDMLAEMNEVRKEFSNPEFLDAERKMKQNPEAAQKWMVTNAASLMMNKFAHALMDFDKNLEDIKNDKEFEKLRSMNLLNIKEGPNSIGTLFDELIEIRKNTDDIIAREEENRAENAKKEDNDSTKRPDVEFDKRISETKLGMEDNISRWISNAGMNMLNEKTDSMVAAKKAQGFEVNTFKGLTLNEMDDVFLVNGGIDDGVHKVNAYDAYVQVHDFNIKLMDMMVEKIPDKMANVKDPEGFRNDIRSIRSLLETAGINQEDMKKYGENLTGDAKKTFDSIRKWETDMMKEDPTSEIHLPKGMTDARNCVNQMLKMYQNAFYEKCGYVDKLDADSMECVVNQARDLEYTKIPEKEVKNEVSEKKQISFDALTKAGMAEQKASVQQANVRTSSREAEKSTEKGSLTSTVKDKEPAL